MALKTPFQAFGIECKPGWKGLYEPLMQLCNLLGVEVVQVKEKFGGLRFYVAGERAKELYQLISAAEAASYHICEDCGEDGVEKFDEHMKPVYKATREGSKGWIRTLCTPCRQNWDAR